ncbi:MAG: DUF882 domain-containing protein [Bauldia sp.]
MRLFAATAVLAVFAGLLGGSGKAAAEDRALKLFNTHTQETATIVFKRNGRYDPRGLAQLNQILRDWRKNQPTKMDPELFDLIWQVYRQTGATVPIHIVCGYRSPETNGMLRRRSKAVAKNSQHMRGKAMDFFIPGVPLAKLRAIGLRMQVGGVGFYPTSGSPFVHMDTGSVRHWPKMTRQQLVAVFPDGKTLHVPSDGKPLPGYQESLAAYQARKGKAENVAVAALEAEDEPVGAAAPAPPVAAAALQREATGDPIVLAAGGADENEDDATARDTLAAMATEAPQLRRAAPVTLAAADVPLPRPSPRARAAQLTDAAFQAPDLLLPPDPLPAEPAASEPARMGPHDNVVLASIAPIDGVDAAPLDGETPFDFEAGSHWNTPKVPAALSRAMAARDISRGASMPIPPTAVVATIDVSRPLRAEAMTTAVLRSGGNPIRDVTPVLAYAAPEPAFRKVSAKRPRVTESGAPLPQLNPLRVEGDSPQMLTGAIRAPRPHAMAPANLTLTALDTQGLRIWIGSQSTRQKAYALLTMPDFSQQPALLDKPELAFAAGFGDAAYRGLRTDRFSGPSVQPPVLVDLTTATAYALR